MWRLQGLTKRERAVDLPSTASAEGERGVALSKNDGADEIGGQKGDEERR